MAELITGYAGVPHISSDGAGRCWAGIVGSDCYILPTMQELDCQVQSANSVSIAPGDAIMYGRHVTVTSSEVLTIDSGSMDMRRNDIVGFHYTKDSGTGIEAVTLEVVKGTPATTAVDPTLPTGDILAGATEAFMPLWRVPLNGLTIQAPQVMAATVVTLEDATEDGETVKHITVAGDEAHIDITNSTAMFTVGSGLKKLTFTSGGHIRVDERASLNDSFTTVGYAVIPNLTTGQPNRVVAGPSSGGGSGPVTLRALVPGDIPNLAASKITSGRLSSSRLPLTAQFDQLSVDGADSPDGLFLIHSTNGYSTAVWADRDAVYIQGNETARTVQYEYSFEQSGIYERKRTRSSVSDPWGSWSAWTKVSS